jgi:hypothetical protein
MVNDEQLRLMLTEVGISEGLAEDFIINFKKRNEANIEALSSLSRDEAIAYLKTEMERETNWRKRAATAARIASLNLE